MSHSTAVEAKKKRRGKRSDGGPAPEQAREGGRSLLVSLPQIPSFGGVRCSVKQRKLKSFSFDLDADEEEEEEEGGALSRFLRSGSGTVLRGNARKRPQTEKGQGSNLLVHRRKKRGRGDC